MLWCVLGPLALAALWLTPPEPARGAAPEVARFVDLAPRSAFAYVSNNDYTGRKYFPQPMCGGVAIFDYDNDGRQDIFFTNGAKLPELKKVDRSFYSCLLRNKGDGTFEDVTARAGLEGANLDFSYGVAAGDYDNDGFTDLFLCQTGRNALFHNNGDGRFKDVTTGSGLDLKEPGLLSVCAAWVDYDNDGRLDLVVSQYTYWTPATDMRCRYDAQNDFYCSPQNYKSVSHTLYHNEGRGVFKDVSRAAGFAVTAAGKGMGIGIADFNDDGLTDVFIANDTEANHLYVNQGRGRFVEEGWAWGCAYNDNGTVVSSMGADVKDYDNDGLVDVFYNNLQGQIWGLFHNQSGRQFRYVTPETGINVLSRAFSGWSNGFIDYDNDGWKDIYSSNGDVDYLGDNTEQHDTLFRNREGKRFEDVSEQLGPGFLRLGYQRGSAFGDLDNDGWMDVVVTSLNKRPRILRNSGAGGSHWLMVETGGSVSNRDGIGAKVKVTTAAGRTLYNHVTTSVGFMSSSDKRVHFGLGAETAVRSVEIRWPSGRLQTIKDVPVDRILKVEEPR